jgi:hypothetical protein
MGNHIKQITVHDALTLIRDERVNRRQRRAGPWVAGYVTLRDETGRVVFQNRPNLIVLRGRTFALERIFNSPIGINGVNSGLVPYISDVNRQVIAFGVGSGGAPAGDPFAPYAPPPTGSAGVALSQAVPFRLHDTSQAGGGNALNYIAPLDIVDYATGVPVTGQPTQTLYYMKRFDVLDPAWYFNETANTVYKAVMTTISENDCRTGTTSNQINELCLYFGRLGTLDANGANTVVSPEMFSRITFPTEYFSGTKALTFEYRIYA